MFPCVMVSGCGKIKNSWGRQLILKANQSCNNQRDIASVDGPYNPIFYKYQIMSYIMDQLDDDLPPRQHPSNLPSSPPRDCRNNRNTPTPAIKNEFIKFLGKFSSSVISSGVRQEEVVLELLLNNVFANISIILTIKLAQHTQMASLHLRLVTPEAKPLTIQGRERRVLFCKVLANRYSLHNNEFKITVSMENGQIYLLSPVYALSCHSYASLSALILHICTVFKQNVEVLYGPVNFAKDACGDGRGSTMEQPDQKMRKLLYYSQFTSVAVNLALDSTTSDERTINRKHQKELESIQSLKNCYVPLKRRNGLELFALHDFTTPKNQVAIFDITLPERAIISEKTSPPSVQRPKNPHQNNFVLNYVRLSRRPEERQMRKIHASNFTNIFCSEVEYWYVGSYNGNPDLMNINAPAHKKLMIVKREEKCPRKSRIGHQKLVLTKIKDGMSMFLPKYYINVERNADSEHQLMCDYIPFPTLADYTTKNRDTLSYQTKIYLGYIIAQGLRYLQEYQIAHLDLKPSNIMLFKRMMIKLIDFGESYHPDIKDHQPGFSVPYSAPENYLHPSHYNHKNDVFSLGVILHQLFFSRFPFYFYDPRHREYVYRKSNFSQYWYSSPQGCMSFGEATIFPILQLLIGKCLSPNPEQRPELEWAVLILRECLDYFY